MTELRERGLQRPEPSFSDSIGFVVLKSDKSDFHFVEITETIFYNNNQLEQNVMIFQKNHDKIPYQLLFYKVEV